MEVGIADVRRAAAELAGQVRTTPALRCTGLEERAGVELWVKAENLQWIGAFKARGALLTAGRITPEQRARGLITYSSGNHAQAVAWAAQRYQVPAEIAMPEDAPAVKVRAVRELGASIVFAGTTSPERKQAALEIQRRTGGTLIEPFDHADTICGQGTATLEFLAQVEESARAPLDALLVPIGGGGLIAGACLAAQGSAVRVYGVEPIGCDSMGRSLAAGALTPVPPAATIADGLKPTCVGALNFEIARRHVAGCFTVGDTEIGAALVALLLSAKLLVEPSGAAALAAALRGELRGKHKRVGVLLSGGNVDAARVGELLAAYA